MFVDMKVDLIDHMGSDLTVVNAARVSFAKESTLIDGELSERDKKLIHYLAKHNHWTPFGHCQATFRIKAPIFVARQLMRHNVGLVVNEVSRRYVDTLPEFYWPEEWRKRAENKKQGSGESLSIDSDVENAAKLFIEDASRWYTRLLAHGVAPEQARMILPQNMMTEWYWTGSIAAFARVFNLRWGPDAQQETSDIVMQIDGHLRPKFPVSWEAMCGLLM